MTTTVIRPQLNGYGALELKRVYQHNLTLGIIVAATIHVGLMGGVLLYRTLMSDSALTVESRPTLPRHITDVDPPPSIVGRRPIARTDPSFVPPSIGIPQPYPDEQVVEDVRFITRDELAELSLPDLLDGTDGAEGFVDSIIVDISEYIPEPGEFVAFQEPPRCVHAEPTVYPELAQLTGREGSVIVPALVDKDGVVRRVKIGKSSGVNAGFDEAALDAVSKYRFRPALQNGQPVAVWVSQRIDFKLD